MILNPGSPPSNPLLAQDFISFYIILIIKYLFRYNIGGLIINPEFFK